VSRKQPAPRRGSATQPELWAGAAGATDEPAGSAGPSCPVQPERDVRVTRAQRGQITWGGSAGPSCPVQPERDARVKRARSAARSPGGGSAGPSCPVQRGARRAGPARAARPDHLGAARARRRGARRSRGACDRRRRRQARSARADVRARGVAGAPATDPKILRGRWVYATRDGVGSGRQIARLVELHAAYRWLCGGVAVAYHRLNDFRSDRGEVFSDLVTQLLARLLKHDLVDLQGARRDRRDGERRRQGPSRHGRHCVARPRQGNRQRLSLRPHLPSPSASPP